MSKNDDMVKVNIYVFAFGISLLLTLTFILIPLLTRDMITPKALNEACAKIYGDNFYHCDKDFGREEKLYCCENSTQPTNNDLVVPIYTQVSHPIPTREQFYQRCNISPTRTTIRGSD